MDVYRIKRTERIDGFWESWFLDQIFSSEKTAKKYIEDNPISEYIRQEVVAQKVI